MLWLCTSLLWAEKPKNTVQTSVFGYSTIVVEAGSFMMGDEQGDIDETPHRVRLSRSFHIGTTEVTVDFWKKVMGTAPWTREQTECMRMGPEERPEHRSPVYCVDWNEAAYFANQLSDWERLEQCYRFDGMQVVFSKGTECLGYRLPTEAEWEFATQTPQRLQNNQQKKEEKSTNMSSVYSGGNDVRTLGWYTENSDQMSQMTGLLKPNARGIYDLSGNLWEWCHDWYGSYEEQPEVDPSGHEHGVYRVLRGGSFSSPMQDLRISNRFRRYPSVRSNQIGFRLARTIVSRLDKQNIDKK